MHKTTLETVLATGMLMLCGACDLESARDDELEAAPGSLRDGWGGPIGYNNDHHAAIFLDTSEVGSTHSITIDTGRGGVHELDAVWVDGGRLYGTADGVEYSGADFNGSVWQVPLSRSGDFQTFEVEITAVEEGEIDHYEFASEQTPVCSGSVGGGPTAIVLGDVFVSSEGEVISEPGTVALGCEGGGVAKAAEWGYAPDGPAEIAGFQAAIRMVIADYCGDGSSYTTEGTPIWMKDGWGIHPDNGAGMWESGWTPDGAVCLYQPRDEALSNDDVECVTLVGGCHGDPFLAGALLVTWNVD